ncbi:glutaredoxin domain-containing protein [Rhodobacter sp. 24-YEA-8]|uniref:glutaredoxin domain-containing protein n=1 Tax=Rhodobacter sp. 24-YEA-8 TaxID=1884310 RepID=UPI0008944774|nr:Glutaredoxin-like protein NrdH [Rhodobacter sp. 24-YEA-8]
MPRTLTIHLPTLVAAVLGAAGASLGDLRTVGREVITLHSKSLCVQCDATRRALDQAWLRYRVMDLTEDAEAMGYVQSLGYRQAPVVVTETERHWSGYQPGKITTLR